MLVYWTVYCRLLIVLQLVNVHCKRCKPQYWGPDCDMMCQCLDGIDCMDDGSCITSCNKHTFGPACQYLDMMTLQDPVNIPIYLADTDASTCNPNPVSTSIDIEFSTSFQFSWYRIIVSTPKYIWNFTTSFGTGKTCWNENKYLLDTLRVDVTCDTDVEIKALHIIGYIAPTVCGLHISGGRNVAFQQKSRQTTNFEIDFRKCESKNAVDGKKSLNYNDSQCSRTGIDSKGPEWSVKFRFPTRLYKINILVPTSETDRFIGFKLSLYDVDGNLDTSYIRNSSISLHEILINTHKLISYIVIKQSTQVLLLDRFMTICEVEAFGDPACPDHTFGIACEQSCTCNNTEACNFVTGSCAPGCLTGFYGFNCSSPCSRHCESATCNVLSGFCSPCSYGYFGVTCDKTCLLGTFQLQESCKNCSLGCTDICNQITGECMCKKTHTGLRCNICMPGTFGPQLSCPNCSHGCIDTCNSTNGECNCRPHFSRPTCSECEAGTFGSHCQFICSRGCANLCSNTDGKCACRKNYKGNYCTECITGTYGSDCQLTCSNGCANNCNVTDGSCICKVGFSGKRCAECVLGLYGPQCKSHCGAGCDGKCNKRTGNCRCKNNYIGTLCKDCRLLTFGSSCKFNCSEGCNNTCNMINGNCVCKKRFTGSQCKECVQPFYGRRCDLTCSKHCLDQKCAQITGKCLSCIKGHHGYECSPKSTSVLGWAIPLLFIVLFVGLIMTLLVGLFIALFVGLFILFSIRKNGDGPPETKCDDV